jgi:hypothetical protein
MNSINFSVAHIPMQEWIPFAGENKLFKRQMIKFICLFLFAQQLLLSEQQPYRRLFTFYRQKQAAYQ